MPKSFMSRAAFLAVIMSAAPVLADDATLEKAVSDMNQKLQQQQQKEIADLQSALDAKKKSASSSSSSQSYVAAPVPVQATQTRPTVVAPLEPRPLGTLRESEIEHPESVVHAPRVQMDVTPTASAMAQPVIGAPTPRAPAAIAYGAPYTVSQPYNPLPSSGGSPGVANPGSVGQAPPSVNKPPEVQALASVGGVLTPYGNVVVEPFFQYSRSSVNTFTFQGVEVVQSLLIGQVAADRTARDLISTGATVRAGVSDRLELEARFPFVYRADSITTTIPATDGQTVTTNAQGAGLGDIEVAGHYQINDGKRDWPFFIGNLRFKSDTGTSPYNVEYNPGGTEHTLATGSGFMAVEPSLTVIYPSDPATLFANLGYIHSFADRVDRNVAGNDIGDVRPGDTISGSAGMGIALNDKLSFTLGYEHDYIFPTLTEISGVGQYSQALQVGSALTGISYRINDRSSVNLNWAAGITRDAPDETVSIRVPISFSAF